jgi:hypothetical protein
MGHPGRPSGPHPSRRAVAAAGAAAVLAACGAGPEESSPRPRRSSPSRSPSGDPSSSTGATPRLPTVTPWRADPGDLVPLCKLTAVHHVEHVGNRRDSALQVIDAQYGGLLTAAASVLVVTRSWRRTPQRLVEDGHTYDVRLSRTPSGWRVTAVHPSAPGRAARRLTPAARRVLASDRIALPPAAELDLRAGRIHDTVLRALLALAASYRIHISVLRSGHPLYVFGTDRLSDHPPGRAFDTWAINGQPVVSPSTPRALVEGYMRAAAEAGSYNVGGPYLLGSAPQWFSDDTHHDHVHAGFAE